MYKGKFNQKGKQSGADIEQLLAQRKAEQERQARQAAAKPAAKTPASQMPPVTRTKPAAPGGKAAPSGKTAPNGKATPAAKTPVRPSVPPKTSAPVPEKKKKGPRLGGVIFYTVYFLFILVFFIATFIGMQWVKNWLVDYQAAQPDVKAEQVFTQLFTNPDWDALYVASGAQDSPFEGKEQFVTYMNGKVDPTQLSYLETSAGLSGGKKYEVRMGSEKVASFTLTDKNTEVDALTRIPDWQLGAVEVFFQREGTYRIEKMESHTAIVNGVTLSDDYTIQIATTKAASYLPVGANTAAKCIQEVNGLMEKPTVEIFDETGNATEVSYNEETHTFTEGTQSQAMGIEEKTAALGAAESYCKWMISELTDRAALAQYYDPTGEAYQLIVKFNKSNLWTQDNTGYQFENEEVTDYVRYSDTLFSCRVTMGLKVNVKVDGSVREFKNAQSLFFSKSDSGKWLCYQATNEDVSQPVGKVRLTFMQGDTMLLTDFFETEKNQIVTPMLTPPEGKVFSGWVRKDESEDGKTTLTLVFQPDSSGVVDIPDGTTITPMTLYALFEDAASAQASAPEETQPQTTQTEGV